MLHNNEWMVRLGRILSIAFVVHFIFCGICFAEFYRYNVDDIARKAQKRLQEIDRKIAKEEFKKELKEILVELQNIFEEAESLFNQKRYEEAAKLYREIERINGDIETGRLSGEINN